MKTFKQLTEKFNWVNSSIESNFPLAERKVGDYKLFHFDKEISSEDAIKEIEKEGYLPANLYELLNWPAWNEKDFVVALGSVGEVDGGRCVPGLDRRASRRGLGLGWFGNDWGACCRFLGVRNLYSDSRTSASTLGNFDTSDVKIKLRAFIESLEELEKLLANSK